MTELDEIEELELVKEGDAPVFIGEHPATPLYAYAKELAEIKMKFEQDREESLIRQAGYMQAAFSFVTMVIFTLLPIIITHRENIPLEVILFALSTVGLSMLHGYHNYWRVKQ